MTAYSPTRVRKYRGRDKEALALEKPKEIPWTPVLRTQSTFLKIAVKNEAWQKVFK
jgi:hypothetical protein